MGQREAGRGGRREAEGERLAVLRERIAGWRRHRSTRAMPEELWSSAAELARAHGVHAVASALGLNHKRLKERCAERGEEEVRPAVPSTGFLELAMVPTAQQAWGSVVELSRADGARMTVRLAEPVDVAELVTAFVRRR